MLDVVRLNSTKLEQITFPYRARMNTARNFIDGASYRSINCSPTNNTNGVDIYATGASFQKAPSKPQKLVNVILDATPVSDVVLPPELQPPSAPLDGSFKDGAFFDLDDGKTSVLALGSFGTEENDFEVMQTELLKGLTEMKARGKTQLIIDVSNNGGGFRCLAAWLHRIIAGPKNTTVPQAGIDTKARNSPFARAIVNEIISNDRDPEQQLLYNPLQWTNASNQPFGAKENWLLPPVNVTINGRPDQFSQRLGVECPPFSSPPPESALFDTRKVVIVSNARCASSCSMLSITMKVLEGAKTVVVGGKKDVQQQYCGTVGGQSTDFATIDTEIKTVHLKNDSAAPPDLKLPGMQGITWRLAFALDGSGEPEEWKDHSADAQLLLTRALVNNPNAIWKEVAKRFFA
ncbi:hypothetical protein E1B28_008310 [Marasmius oreades]|uniref:Tail specific protease domain-containing protein n=1 Tax=Marasmius oreades TaxID=181124 RepID=A0A9P7RYS7_9AGAR|nr:uncharacterized protein E1B28_008310 [Marasmius oreades]KAG7091915.1 hypothetical protein E1B28_008310 [Marasmius oreades]